MAKLKLRPKSISDSLILALPFLKRFRKTSHTLIEVEIDSKAIVHNATSAAKFTGMKIAPVLKSNAYGHGLIEVAGILEKVNHERQFPFFAVDSYFEALTLRQVGIETEILILGYSFVDTIKKSRLKDVAFTISSVDALEELTKSKCKTTIHIKIDTGMHRQGIDVAEIPKVLELIKMNQQIILEGIASHLSDAHNDLAPEFTQKQIETWNKCVDNITKEFPALKYVHLTNTAGLAYHDRVRMNVGRLGLGLYGFADRPELEAKLELRPALKMKSVISQIKEVHPNECIGYNCAYKSAKGMYVAVVPAGYNEGVDRRLSNTNNFKANLSNVRDSNDSGVRIDPDKEFKGGIFQVNGQPCPIVGLISMNMTTIDVTELVKRGEVKRDDEVVIISNNPKDPNSIKAIACQIGVIAYETSVKIPDSLRRVVK